MPEFNTVEFNALPHHSPCAVLVTSDCCHLYARTRRIHAAHRIPSAPFSPAAADPGTSLPITATGGIVRAYDRPYDGGHTDVCCANTVQRRADTKRLWDGSEPHNSGAPVSNGRPVNARESSGRQSGEQREGNSPLPRIHFLGFVAN
ncbi:hypothetical protein GONAM_06_00880 [Gordonia namibiensis NBRC 108229]|uniref:Uncharacterized protein n=1 Tax=Gordonia namibiensis NBRC 108229 TaxID=1208314 RepID=K6VRY2_9ACTN|nr:hypothetical protein GONAM_06_00880 [Gordonia namibiensis NBRC 108229]